MEVHRLQAGDKIRVEELEQKLGALHYQPVSAVSAPGQYAMRGAAFDIFPVSYRLPVRLRIIDDVVANIRDFTLSDGRNLTVFDEVFLLPVSDFFQKNWKNWKSNSLYLNPFFAPKIWSAATMLFIPSMVSGNFWV